MVDLSNRDKDVLASDLRDMVKSFRDSFVAKVTSMKRKHRRQLKNIKKESKAHLNSLNTRLWRKNGIYVSLILLVIEFNSVQEANDIFLYDQIDILSVELKLAFSEAQAGEYRSWIDVAYIRY